MISLNILHIDMDAFFAAIEQRDHPEWRGKPVIVGAPPHERGVVSTASYEARVYGVHSAMPSREAYRRCPHGIFVSGNHHHYSEVSQQVMAILQSISPKLEQVSVDEAFLDLSGVLGREGKAVETAEEIRGRIRNELHLTASVGIAPNMFLAKLASDLHKPDGLTVVPESPAEIASFLAPLPVGRIWGVGTKTNEILAKFNLRTIGDVQQASTDFLTRILGSYGPRLHDLSFGIDCRAVQSEAPPEKSMSQEYTFKEDCLDYATVRAKLLEQCELVAARLRRHEHLATCAVLKLRFQDFRTITRQMPVKPAANSDRILRDYALRLLQDTGLVSHPRPIRLVGFGASALIPVCQETPPMHQPSLFEDENRQQDLQEETRRRDNAIDRAVDELRQRFGHTSIHRG
ncbi:MAG: DNA polymerase IV [Victivallales bacterium]|nr:DNA polymerase IV [Victivallales bacterium]